MVETFLSSISNTSPRAGSKRKREETQDVPRTIENAVVLTVLALGKLCKSRESAPDVDPENPHHSSLRDRGNSDIVPGSEYLAIATGIIRNELRGSIHHVRANLFAGLYHRQLGQVVESYEYITQGCRSLMKIFP